MKEKNQQESPEESRERRRIAERDKRRNPKMKMTGKGMKRFANPKSHGAGSSSTKKPIPTSNG